MLRAKILPTSGESCSLPRSVYGEVAVPLLGRPGAEPQPEPNFHFILSRNARLTLYKQNTIKILPFS